MSRKKILPSSTLPLHIYSRSNDKEWFYIDKADMWDICMSNLFYVTVAYGLRVHAFTLMDNHFHLLASTPFSNIGSIMNYFMRETSKEVNRRTNKINHVYGGTYKASRIEHALHYFNVYRYIYQNPVRAGLCKTVEDYKFNTIRTLFGQDKNPLPLYPSVFDLRYPITNNYNAAAKWINRSMEVSFRSALSEGLKKTTFDLPKDRKTRLSITTPREDEAEIDALLNQK